MESVLISVFENFRTDGRTEIITYLHSLNTIWLAHTSRTEVAYVVWLALCLVRKHSIVQCFRNSEDLHRCKKFSLVKADIGILNSSTEIPSRCWSLKPICMGHAEHHSWIHLANTECIQIIVEVTEDQLFFWTVFENGKKTLSELAEEKLECVRKVLFWITAALHMRESGFHTN